MQDERLQHPFYCFNFLFYLKGLDRMYDGSRIVRDVRIKKIRLNLHFRLAAMKANNFFCRKYCLASCSILRNSGMSFPQSLENRDGQSNSDVGEGKNYLIRLICLLLKHLYSTLSCRIVCPNTMIFGCGVLLQADV